MENSNYKDNIYVNEKMVDDFKKEREKCVVMSVKSNTKDIAFDALLMTADTFGVGVGILGTVVFGKNFIKNINSQNGNSSIKEKTITFIHGVPIILSSSQILLGVRSFCERRQKLQKDLNYRRRLIKKLDYSKVDEKNEY